MSLAKAFYLNKGNVTFNGVWLLLRDIVSFLSVQNWLIDVYSLIGLTPGSWYTWPLM
jgi:hypothetical protein